MIVYTCELLDSWEHMRRIVIRLPLTADAQNIVIIARIDSSVGNPLRTRIMNVITHLEENTESMIMGVTEVFIHLTIHELKVYGRRSKSITCAWSLF